MTNIQGPLVSVVVPFYQAGDRLRATLNSIAASTYRHLDVLMIDDASTDHSTDTALEFATSDPRFRYFRNAENRNVSFSRNRGIQEAAGDYMVFVDSDDQISPDWIERLLDNAVGEQADVVIGKSKRCVGGHVEEYPMRGLRRRGALPFSSIILKDNSVVWNKLYAATLIRQAKLRFDENIYIGEDLLFNYRVLRQANRIFYSDRGFYCYHADHLDSIMRGSDAAARAENFSRLLSLLEEEANQPGAENRGVLLKVARDVLNNYFAADGKFNLATDTMARIRRVDYLLPEKIRINRYRKTIRHRVAVMLGLENR